MLCVQSSIEIKFLNYDFEIGKREGVLQKHLSKLYCNTLQKNKRHFYIT